ncbi:MAG: hypothetical protein WC560_10085 [Syntrophales bacterium]
MKEIPILFKSEMVKAILEGRKTQTRRIVKLGNFDGTDPLYETNDGYIVDVKTMCPYGQVGDHLWVRETWMHRWTPPEPTKGTTEDIIYKASNPELGKEWKWRPSIFMPRWASRITLEITDIRVQRLQEIPLRDIEAEGVWIYEDPYKGRGSSIFQCRMRYARLWDSINGTEYPWQSNPFIWAITFKRIDK